MTLVGGARLFAFSCALATAVVILSSLGAATEMMRLAVPAYTNGELDVALSIFEEDEQLKESGIEVVRIAFDTPEQSRGAVGSGDVDLALVTSDVFTIGADIDWTLPFVTLIAEPLQYRSTKELQQVQNSVYGEAALTEFEKVGLVGLTFFNHGQSQLYAHNEINTIDDLRGLGIGTATPDRPAAVMEHLGATAISLMASDVPLAVERGAIGAVEAVASQAAELMRVFSEGVVLPSYRPFVSILIANEAFWDGLSERQKAAVMGAAKRGAKFSQERTDEAERAFLAEVAEARTVSVSHFATSAHDAIAVEAVYRRLYGEEIKPAFEALTEILREIRGNSGVRSPDRRGAIPLRDSAVVFVTNRNEDLRESDPAFRFGSRRVDATLKCGSARKVDGSIILDGSTSDLDCIRFVAEATADHGSRPLVYIHGYNTTFLGAVTRSKLLAKRIGSPVVAWSWPSDGTVVRYMYDEESVRWSRRHLNMFVEALLKTERQIDLIAHSMGARLALWLMERLEAKGLGDKVRVIVFAAPDEAREIFREILHVTPSVASIRTLYASSGDRALQLSRHLHGAPRAGTAGPGLVIQRGLDTVDASYFDRLLRFNHDHVFVIDELLHDFELQIRLGHAARERALLERRMGGQSYWVIEGRQPGTDN